MAVYFAPQLPPVACAEAVAAAVNRDFTVQCAVQHGVSAAHRVTGGDREQPLAHEARHRHAFIGSNDDAVCSGDLVAFQFIIYADCAVGLHFDRQAALLRRLAQRFGCQVGVRHAHGAGRDSQQPVLGRGGRGLGGRCFGGLVGLLVPGDHFAKRLGRGGRQHLPAEFLVEQQRGQACQHLHMQVVGIRRCSDQKQKAHRLAVRRIAGQRRIQRQRGQLGVGHTRAFGVGDSQPAAHADAAHFFTFQGILFKLCGVGQAAAFLHQFHQLVDRRRQRVCLLAQRHAARPQVICDVHQDIPLWAIL